MVIGSRHLAFIDGRLSRDSEDGVLGQRSLSPATLNYYGIIVVIDSSVFSQCAVINVGGEDPPDELPVFAVCSRTVVLCVLGRPLDITGQMEVRTVLPW